MIIEYSFMHSTGMENNRDFFGVLAKSFVYKHRAYEFILVFDPDIGLYAVYKIVWLYPY